MSISIQLKTPRLTLTGADEAILKAAIAGIDALQATMGVAVPSAWPPEHLDASALEWTMRTLCELPGETPWRMYFIVNNSHPRTLIGTCGFKGPPDAGGEVEIGYSILPAFQRRGFATEASQALIELAFAIGVNAVAAETFPELVASLGVMRKCGMVHCGAGSEAGTVRYSVEVDQKEREQ